MCFVFVFFSEGDRKAYYETSQHAMKHNQDTVLKLRKEVKELRKKLSDSLSVSIWIVLFFSLSRETPFELMLEK